MPLDPAAISKNIFALDRLAAEAAAASSRLNMNGILVKHRHNVLRDVI